MKKILKVICMIICTMTLVACNKDEDSVNGSQQGNNTTNQEQENITDNDIIEQGTTEDGTGANMMLTINGKSYDLTTHFNENVSDMVKNGLVVCTTNRLIYDETGYQFSGEITGEENADIVFATQVSAMSANTTINYYISTEYGNAFKFETLNGIKDGFTVDDLKALDGFVPAMIGYLVAPNWSAEEGEYACAALYVDGEMVDLSSYEEDAEYILEDVTRTQNFWLREGDGTLATATPEFETSRLLNDNMLNGNIKEDPNYEQYKNMLMLLLAERDAFWDIQDGKGEYMCLVSYIYIDDISSVLYQLYGTDCTPNRDWEAQVK